MSADVREMISVYLLRHTCLPDTGYVEILSDNSTRAIVTREYFNYF